jgi:hypothetical protein
LYRYVAVLDIVPAEPDGGRPARVTFSLKQLQADPLLETLDTIMPVAMPEPSVGLSLPLPGCHSTPGVSDCLRGPPWPSSIRVFDTIRPPRVVTPGCRIRYRGRTGCHRLNRVLTAK